MSSHKKTWALEKTDTSKMRHPLVPHLYKIDANRKEHSLCYYAAVCVCLHLCSKLQMASLK